MIVVRDYIVFIVHLLEIMLFLSRNSYINAVENLLNTILTTFMGTITLQNKLYLFNYIFKIYIKNMNLNT